MRGLTWAMTPHGNTAAQSPYLSSQEWAVRMASSPFFHPIIVPFHLSALRTHIIMAIIVVDRPILAHTMKAIYPVWFNVARLV